MKNHLIIVTAILVVAGATKAWALLLAVLVVIGIIIGSFLRATTHSLDDKEKTLMTECGCNCCTVIYIGVMFLIFYNVEHTDNNYADGENLLPSAGPGEPQHYDCADRTVRHLRLVVSVPYL